MDEHSHRQHRFPNGGGSSGDVGNSIGKTLTFLHQIELAVSSFTVASLIPLLHRLNALVTELGTMQELADNCNIQIPLQVLNLIDDGTNPDEFTRNVFNNCLSKNQITKGKSDAFKSLRKHLLDDLTQTFPDEVQDFRKIRAESKGAGTDHDQW